ncbi:Predicted protein [Anoxybacillus flavithermus WK1]|uniref:Uncharacterized protein n=1 Tax=Anoxybacillus flavithermus (strain DSM 21510 / WK1) TaxID=491915 RepID=B7GJY8_ANOFW|nr:Predicted protein [Anoxybacillus flavithermus WK1]
MFVSTNDDYDIEDKPEFVKVVQKQRRK